MAPLKLKINLWLNLKDRERGGKGAEPKANNLFPCHCVCFLVSLSCKCMSSNIILQINEYLVQIALKVLEIELIFFHGTDNDTQVTVHYRHLYDCCFDNQK